ncbi:MAG: LysR family transcriptional regulator [Myxococcales bacterium]|nr:LysR family transcriptional regulator [Myxococcales bacterium]
MASLESLNLNLLVTLDALLEARSVTAAARRLGLTQSAVSHALGRLRALLGDAVLVRTPAGMVPTPRAAALEAPLRRALLGLHHLVFEPPGFDPGASTRTFRVATSDLFAVFLAPVVARSRADAPGVDLDIVGSGADPFEGLESGAVDVAIGVNAPGAERFLRLVLLRERFVCLVRTDHPEVGEALDLDTFCRLPHALISPSGRGGGAVDAALAQVGRSRRIALRIKFFLAAPFALARSDLILTAPSRLAQELAAALPLRIVEPPLALPDFDLCLFFHERLRDDPGHRWLRGMVQAALAGEGTVSRDPPGGASLDP